LKLLQNFAIFGFAPLNVPRCGFCLTPVSRKRINLGVRERAIRTFIVSLALLVLGFAHQAAAQLRYKMPPDTVVERMFREVHRGGQHIIYASGTISAGDTTTFEQFVRQRGITRAEVHFNSDGGSLAEALTLGRKIRQLGFETRIASDVEGQRAVCASACAYAFAGGTSRYFDEASGQLGLHQFYSPGQTVGAISDVQEVSSVLVAYLHSMGVDARAFSVAAAAKQNEMIWLSVADAEQLNLVDNGAEPPTAEIKTQQMLPYLRLEQVRAGGYPRILLTCAEGELFMMAGIVNSPDNVEFMSAAHVRSYILLDGHRDFEAGPGGARGEDSVIWLERSVSPDQAERILRANRLEIWVEGGGAVGLQGIMNLGPVKAQVQTYVSDCRASGR
jgi:hypothetical protein